MNNEQINTLNEELIKFQLKNSFYAELKRNNNGWHSNIYKFMAICNPVYAVMSAFSIDSLPDQLRQDFQSFNSYWIDFCFQRKWVGSKLIKYNSFQFHFAIDIIFGEGNTNSGRCPALDQTNILTAIELVEFSDSTGFSESMDFEEYKDKIKDLVLEGIKRKNKIQKETENKANKAAVSVFDEYEKKRKKEEEEAARKAEEEARLAEEEARLAQAAANLEKRNILWPYTGSIRSHINNYEWSEAASDILLLVNQFNELFKTEGKAKEPDAEEEHEAEEEPVTEDCAEDNQPEEVQEEKKQSRRGIKLGQNQISMSIKSNDYYKFHLNPSMGKFLFENGFLNVSVYKVENHTFICFSKKRLNDGCNTILNKNALGYEFFSISFSRTILTPINKFGDTYGIINLSSNLSNNSELRRFEIIEYESR